MKPHVNYIRMRFLVTFCFTLYCTTFLQAQSAPAGSPHQMIVSDTNCAIIAYNPLYYGIFKDASAATLSAKELYTVDSIYAYCKNDHRNELISTAHYKRQYMVVLNKKGEKEVWVNCFCWNYGADWRNTIVSVDDGGNCFFNLKINLTKKEYYNFDINGNG